jgi:cytochrome o ubiquinol oxidase subunit 3
MSTVPTYLRVPSSGGDPHNLGAKAHGSGDSKSGPPSKRIITGYGFWIFLLSDFVMFSAFFAAYAVLSGHTDGGPTPKQIFDLSNVAWETALLLASSFLCGLSVLAADKRSMIGVQVGLLLTGLLGFGFVVLEVREFVGLIAQGAGPDRSAFLSAFFALVGCHGLHVSCGLLWLGTMMAQIWVKGFRPHILRRLMCFSLFWHALDIIWVALFTIVYLLGKLP